MRQAPRAQRAGLIGTLAAILALSLVPADVFSAESPSPGPPAPSPSASPPPGPPLTDNPSPAPSTSPTPAGAAVTPLPSASPSPSARPNPSQNKEARNQLIRNLTVSEAYALALQRSLAQSQLKLLTLGQQVLDADRELASLNARLDAVRAEHIAVAEKLQDDRRALTAVVRQLYKRQRDFFGALLESGGFGGLLRSMGYSEVVLERENALVKSVQADEAALASAQADLDRTRGQQQAARDRLEVSRAELAKQVEVQRRLLGELQRTIDDALTALEATQTDTEATAQQRAHLIQLKTDTLLAQIQQAVWNKLELSPTQLAPIDAEFKSSGRFLWPIPQATVTQGFGPSPYFFEPAFAGFPHFHTGMDLAVPMGTPVLAAADGVVVGARPMTDGAGNLVGYGNFVILEHNDGLRTLYAHLLTILVKEGQTVRRGQLIGLVGSTGNSTGAHTHFEVRVANTPVDPLNVLAPKSGP